MTTDATMLHPPHIRARIGDTVLVSPIPLGRSTYEEECLVLAICEGAETRLKVRTAFGDRWMQNSRIAGVVQTKETTDG